MPWPAEMPTEEFKDKVKIMPRFDKLSVLSKMGTTGMVPVFYHKDAQVAKMVLNSTLRFNLPLTLPRLKALRRSLL